MSENMTIGELAKQAGVPASTVRYYERRGLLHPAGRNESNYRIYGADSMSRLRFVRAAQSCGLSLEDIEMVLAFAHGEVQTCAEVQTVINFRLEQVKQQMSELREVSQALEKLHDSCCESEQGSDCPAIEEIKEQAAQQTPGT